MAIKILLFGRLAELAGNAVISLEDIADTNSLKTQLAKEYPQLQGLNYLIAVDKQVVTNNQPIQEISTIALLPPFSGG